MSHGARVPPCPALPCLCPESQRTHCAPPPSCELACVRPGVRALSGPSRGLAGVVTLRQAAVPYLGPSLPHPPHVPTHPPPTPWPRRRMACAAIVCVLQATGHHQLVMPRPTHTALEQRLQPRRGARVGAGACWTLAARPCCRHRGGAGSSCTARHSPRRCGQQQRQGAAGQGQEVGAAA